MILSLLLPTQPPNEWPVGGHRQSPPTIYRCWRSCPVGGGNPASLLIPSSLNYRNKPKKTRPPIDPEARQWSRCSPLFPTGSTQGLRRIRRIGEASSSSPHRPFEIHTWSFDLMTIFPFPSPCRFVIPLASLALAFFLFCSPWIMRMHTPPKHLSPSILCAKPSFLHAPSSPVAF